MQCGRQICTNTKYEGSRYQGFPIRATHRTATQRPAQATHLCAPQGPPLAPKPQEPVKAQATPHLASGCCPSTPPPATWSSRTPQVPLWLLKLLQSSGCCFKPQMNVQLPFPTSQHTHTPRASPAARPLVAVVLTVVVIVQSSEPLRRWFTLRARSYDFPSPLEVPPPAPSPTSSFDSRLSSDSWLPQRRAGLARLLPPALQSFRTV